MAGTGVAGAVEELEQPLRSRIRDSRVGSGPSPIRTHACAHGQPASGRVP